MTVCGGSPPSGAEHYVAGRFSEALNKYDIIDDDSRSDENNAEERRNSRCQVREILKRVYAACNRAAAKLELEMWRSCVRDCDEAIAMDPFCLRAYVLKGTRPRQPFHQSQ